VPTRTSSIEDRGIVFVVHLTELQDRKASETGEPRALPANPFLPPDPDLFVEDLPPRHFAVLNKFNVLHHHLLIVTRDFEAQEERLNRGDLAALATCMNRIDGIGFYNGGTVAGASQPHKHLQLVPLPLGPGPGPTPIDAVIDPSSKTGSPRTIEPLPFRHALIALDGSRISVDRANELHRLYLEACAFVGVDDGPRPYNMLLTRRWMLVVPRSREHWGEVSINALGFAGSLLVRTRSELEELGIQGPLAALRTVVEP
jgi:ATP adenylyltransferase